MRPKTKGPKSDKGRDNPRGRSTEPMGFRDVLAFILAAFWSVLPFTLLVIAVFVILLLILKFVF